jgi:hypothetical protein
MVFVSPKIFAFSFTSYFFGRRLEFSPLRGFNALAAPAPAASAPLSFHDLRSLYEKIRTVFQR